MVVSDTGPLNYLIWIEAPQLLPLLYGEVVIPSAVLEELKHSQTPAIVRNWLQCPPEWLQVQRSSTPSPSLPHLGKGEKEAIELAIELHAYLLLMDDRDGVRAARSLGVQTTGALGVLDQAAQRNLVDLAERRLGS